MQVPIYAAYLYDAISLYAGALDTVLEKGEDPMNGKAIMSKIFNRTYHSKRFEKYN